MCDCAQLETTFEGLRASEDAVAKALNISEVGQIARAELRYRQYLLAQWNTLAAQATKRASSMARQGKSADAIARAAGKVMRNWADRVLPRAKEEFDKIYRLARTAGWKKATGQTKASLTYDTPNLTELTVEKAVPGFAALPAFDVIDDEAIAALQGQQVLWIGEHYDKNLAAGIQTTTRETMLEAGRNRAVAGRLMQERMAQQFAHVRTPGGFHGSVEQYFEGLAANAATVARAHGQLSSFMRVGATRYEVVNPRDRRTCFRYNTPVLLADGRWKMIQFVEPGDMVVTRAGRPRKVLDRFVKQASDWSVIELDGKEVVESTSDHLIAEEGGGWVEAGNSYGHRVERIGMQEKSSVLGLWVGLQPSSELGHSSRRNVLFQRVFLQAKETAARCVRILSDLQRAVSRFCFETKPNLLFGCVCSGSLGGGNCAESLSGLQRNLRGQKEICSSLCALQYKMQESVREEREDTNRIEAAVPSVQESFSIEAVRNQTSQILLGEMLSSSGEHELCIVQKEVQGDSYRAGDAAPLLDVLLSKRRGAFGIRDRSWKFIEFVRDWLRNRSKSRSLDRRLLASSQSNRGSGWDLLALKARGSREGREENPVSRIEGVQGDSRSRSFDEEQSKDQEVAFGLSTVTAVSQYRGVHRAYDLEVDEDHSFVVWPGLVVHNCPVCVHMDGKTFTVQQGADQMFAELKATDPDEIKKIHPWHSKKELDKISAKPGQLKGKAGAKDSADLANAGFSIPPFHGRCRCAVDIDSDEGVIALPQNPPTPKVPATPAIPKIPGAVPSKADQVLLNRLANGVIKSKTPIGEGVMGAEKALMAHEGKTGNAVLKLAKDERVLRPGIPVGKAVNRETAAYQIDQAMGGKTIVPPTVTRDLGKRAGGQASLQTFVEGALPTKDPAVQSLLFNMRTSGAITREASGRRMFLLDIISANDDRHSQNVMWKIVTRKGKKSLKFIAIDNGLTFPGKNGPVRYIFPVPSTTAKQAKTLLKLNAASQKQLANLTMEKVAGILKATGIEDDAIRAAMIRVRAMQINPKVIAEIEAGRNAGPGRKVLEFLESSHTRPAKLRPIGTGVKEWNAELKSIDKIIAGGA